MNYDNSLKFARYLSQSRQYDFAAEEYERLHFQWPDDTTVSLELVSTYRLNQDCSQFYNSFQILSSNNRIFNQKSFSREYLKFCLSCKMEHPLYFDITSTLDQDEKAFYTLGYYWALQQYDSAFSFNSRNADILSENNPQLFSLTQSFQMQRFKNPVLAMAMSAVLPGSGKAYSKRWGDATVSFILVSTSAFASYRAFKRKGIKSVNGWIFGGVAFSFYSSNIYGSYKSAKRYNEDLRIQYQNNAESTIYNSF
ncbi:MAG: hypothetical protein P1P86_16015 [Bacteroidales bacterium]|nr:hypothetical protein [Bacteroidales bacterium]